MSPHRPVTTIDVEAVALSLCMTCKPGVDMCCRGSPLSITTWEACVTAFALPAEGLAGYRPAAHSIDQIIRATQHLLGRMPTAYEMWLIESTIRRIR